MGREGRAVGRQGGTGRGERGSRPRGTAANRNSSPGAQLVVVAPPAKVEQAILQESTVVDLGLGGPVEGRQFGRCREVLTSTLNSCCGRTSA